MRVVVQLSEQEEAHVALIMQVSASEQAEVQRRQHDRLGPIYRAHQIPAGTTVSISAQKDGQPATLSYEGSNSPEWTRHGLDQATENYRAQSSLDPNYRSQSSTDLKTVVAAQDIPVAEVVAPARVRTRADASLVIGQFLNDRLPPPTLWFWITGRDAISIRNSGHDELAVLSGDWYSVPVLEACLREALARLTFAISVAESDPPQPDAGSRTEKSTSADAPET